MVTHPLDDARSFAASVLYASDVQLDALTLAAAATHALESFPTTFRLLFVANGPATGKTTALDTFGMLASNSWSADGATGPALRSKFNAPERPTLIFDEVSRIFGMSGRNGSGSQLGDICRRGYRRSATFSMSVGRVVEDVPCYAPIAMAGLKVAVPEDVRTRSIVFPMVAKPAGLKLLPSQDMETEMLGQEARAQLRGWVRSQDVDTAARNLSQIHPKLVDRARQVWSPLFVMAELAGGTWPARCLEAFRTLALDAADIPQLTMGQMAIRDAAALLRETGSDFLGVRELLNHVRTLTEPHYAEMSDRGLCAHVFAKALGETTVTTRDGESIRGWFAKPILEDDQALTAHLADLAARAAAPAEREFWEV